MKARHLVFGLLFALRLDAGAEIRYTVRNLGTLGGASSAAHAINESGQVAGRSDTGVGTDEHAFLWLPEPAFGLAAGVHDLGSFAGEGTSSLAFGLNELGSVVGQSSNGLTGPLGLEIWRPFKWREGVLSDPGLLTPGYPFGGAAAINAADQVVGYESSGLCQQALLWLPEPAYGLPAGPNRLPALPGFPTATAADINDLGQVVGASTSCDVPSSHITLWLPEEAFGLPAGINDLSPTTPPNRSSEATAISASGLITGHVYASDTSPPYLEAFLWENGTLTRLGALPGQSSSFGYDVNSAGAVVGESGIWGAFLWENGVMRHLNDLIDPASGWELRSARGINDRGQIVGHGLYQGQLRAYLLEPPLFADGFESGDLSAWDTVVP